MSELREIVIVIPTYNDWEPLHRLLGDIDQVCGDLKLYKFRVVIVNDGSTIPLPDVLSPSELKLRHISKVEHVKLVCNLGHQRAIAVGLVLAATKNCPDAVLVMDSDGEDRPVSIPKLIEAWEKQPESTVLAKRSKRSEGAVFRTFYAMYKILFRALTGRRMDFGNFCVIPRIVLEQLIHIPDIWNNLAATIVRSRFSLTRVPIKRGVRYAGKSKMSIVSLMVHGMSAISVHSDVVLVRLLVTALCLTIVSLVGVGVVVAIRFMTALAIPGWATNVVGFLLLGFIQSVVLAMVAAFLLFQNRAGVSLIPSHGATDFVSEVEVIFER